MMVAVLIVISQDPTIIPGAQRVIHKSQVVPNHHTVRILPDFFADDASAYSAADLRHLVYDLPRSFKTFMLHSGYHR